MMKKDVPVLKLKVLDMMPMAQAEVWKKLGIDGRDCSDLINMMVEEGLLIKTEKDKTYLITATKNGKIYSIISACLSIYFDNKGYKSEKEYISSYKKRLEKKKRKIYYKHRLHRQFQILIESRGNDENSLFSNFKF